MIDLLRMVPSCEYLEFRVSESEKERAAEYLVRASREGLSIEEVRNVVEMLCSFDYEPHCNQKNSVCVVMESPVIALQDFGGMYQPFLHTLANSSRIEDCPERVLPEVNADGMETLTSFLLRHIAMEKPDNVG